MSAHKHPSELAQPVLADAVQPNLDGIILSASVQWEA